MTIIIENVSWRNVWSLPLKYLLTNKVREVSFKLIHRFYPVKSWYRYKQDLESDCLFCNSSVETVSHLFWNCFHTMKFWSDILDFIHTYLIADFSFCFKDVFFGVLDCKMEKEGKYFIINLLFLLAKYHIHKCKFSGSKPFFPGFKNELCEYMDSIKYSKKTLKLGELWYYIQLY